MYSERIVRHLNEPCNVGTLPNADIVGSAVNLSCGDSMVLYAKISDSGIVTDIRFKTNGCGVAVAVASIVTEQVKGKTAKEAVSVTEKVIADIKSELSPQKTACADFVGKSVVQILSKT